MYSWVCLDRPDIRNGMELRYGLVDGPSSMAEIRYSSLGWITSLEPNNAYPALLHAQVATERLLTSLPGWDVVPNIDKQAETLMRRQYRCGVKLLHHHGLVEIHFPLLSAKHVASALDTYEAEHQLDCWLCRLNTTVMGSP